jgi:prepilin-type N-terminal cleavage/methylation domain-containing protein
MTARRFGGRRGGFTFIELLVVVVIILTLVALSTAAVVRYLGVQQVSNTKTTLTKLTQLLNRRWNTVAEHAYRIEVLAQGGAAYNYVKQIAGTDPLRMQVVWTKLRQRQEFPQTFDEALNAPPSAGGVPAPPQLAPLATYTTYLTTQNGITGSSASTSAFESSACLLLALQRTAGGGGYKPEDIGSSGAVVEMTAGSGKVKVLVDAWGSPLAFFRWPTGSVELNPPGTPSPGTGQPGATNDTGDPTGLLCAPSWQGTSGSPSTNYNNFTTVLGYFPPFPSTAGGGSAPLSFKLKPLIVSAGPDKLLGLDSTAAASTPVNANLDNISNADLQ